jgi:ADP-ribosyl-[dinitrogen reductase] hydrolase
MTGGGPFGLEAGQWTDDTSMAMCLAESLLETGGMDLRDQMNRYIRWRDEGHLSSNGRCFDIGNTVSAALRRFEATGDPLAGSTSADRAANGSIMRLAPVAMFFASDPAAAIEACERSSLTTHATPVVLDACRYLGSPLVGAFAGATREELLAPQYTPIPGYCEAHPLGPEVRAVVEGSFRNKRPPRIRGTG